MFLMEKVLVLLVVTVSCLIEGSSSTTSVVESSEDLMSNLFTSEMSNVTTTAITVTGTSMPSTSIVTETVAMTPSSSAALTDTSIMSSSMEPSTTELSTSISITSSLMEPSTTELSNNISITSLMAPSTTELSNNISITSLMAPSTTELSTSISITSSSMAPSTTELSTSISITSSSMAPSTTELSTSISITSSSMAPSTTELSTSISITSSSMAPSTTELSTSISITSSSMAPSTTELSTSISITSSSMAPSTTELSTSISITSSSMAPSTTELSTSISITSSLMAPSTTELGISTASFSMEPLPSTSDIDTNIANSSMMPFSSILSTTVPSSTMTSESAMLLSSIPSVVSNTTTLPLSTILGITSTMTSAMSLSSTMSSTTSVIEEPTSEDLLSSETDMFRITSTIGIVGSSSSILSMETIITETSMPFMSTSFSPNVTETVTMTPSPTILSTSSPSSTFTSIATLSPTPSIISVTSSSSIIISPEPPSISSTVLVSTTTTTITSVTPTTTSVSPTTTSVPLTTTGVPTTTTGVPPTTTSVPTTTTGVPTTPPTISTSSGSTATNPVIAVLGVLFAFVVIALLAMLLILVLVLRKYVIKPTRSRDYELQKLEADGETGDNIALLAVTSTNESKLGDLFTHIPKEPPIELTALEFHVKRLQDEDVAKEEFVGLSEYARDFPQTQATLSANAIKNRYINILPYDETRVLLSSSKKEGSDYINANYIQGYNHAKEYIAAQGPLPHTIDDFWRMIWETGCEMIIMVTNPVEGGTLKCEVYWPQESSGQQYGTVSVTNIEETIEPACTLRKFMITQARKLSTSNKDVAAREVIQYHFTAWPDMGVPNDSATMLRFVKRMRSSVNSDKPILVHCSAGVGRTGTFIALDILIQRMSSHENVNIKELILQMRAQRCNMVQTPAQYVFVYSSLLYEYWYGETLINKEELEAHYEKLQEAFPYTEDSRLDKEFEGAQNIIKPDPGVMKEAYNPRNVWRNREGAGIPFDFNRVALSKGSNGNCYINASFVGCLGRTAEYILTQNPLPDTSMDFWKMVLERHINVIVILGTVKEDDEYWPDSEPLEWYEEDITVTLLDKDESKNIKAISLEVESDMNESFEAVTLFQVSHWPSDGTAPNDHFTIIELIESIQELKTGLVAIHTAADFEEASGVFAVLCSLVPYLSVSSKVNVMEAVRRTIQQRPGCITTKDQYEFIYETLIASLTDTKK